MYAKHLLALSLALAALASAAAIAKSGLDAAAREAVPEAEFDFTDPKPVLARNIESKGELIATDPERVL